VQVISQIILWYDNEEVKNVVLSGEIQLHSNPFNSVFGIIKTLYLKLHYNLEGDVEDEEK